MWFSRHRLQKHQKREPVLQQSAGNPFLYDVRQYGDVFGDVYSVALGRYFEQTTIPETLHTRGEPWKNGDGTAAPNPVVNHLHSELMRDVTGFYAKLLDARYKVMVYAGVMDGSSCCHMAVYDSVLALDWGNKKEFRAAEKEVLKYERIQGGEASATKDIVWSYRQQGGGLSFVWVVNAGHLVPTDQPRAGLALLDTFLGEGSTRTEEREGGRQQRENDKISSAEDKEAGNEEVIFG